MSRNPAAGEAVWWQAKLRAPSPRMAARLHTMNATRMALWGGTVWMMKRIERVRLYPSNRQISAAHYAFDVTRDLWNAALQQRRDAWRRGKRITGKEQYAEVTALRAEDPRVRAVYRECLDAVLHRLDLSFAAFFRRIKRGETPGYPRFKPRDRWRQLEFSHGDRALRFDVSQQKLYVPMLGWVRVRKGRRVPATFGRAWIVERNGRWYACFECERAPVQGPVDVRDIVGVDRGVHVLAACSDATLLRNVAVGEKRRAATVRLQRELDAATKKDTRGRVLNRRDPKRVQAVKRLSRAKEREANARRDYAHKSARELVNKAQVIALEALRLTSMTRSAKGSVEEPGRNVAAKAALNRRILDAGFGLLEQMIVAKAEEAGRMVVRVDARFSSQECSRCGLRAAGSRRRRRFRCVACGFACHADVNAALVIRRRAELRLMRVPDTGGEPVTLHDAA